MTKEKLRTQFLNLATRISRKTACLDSLKSRLGISNFVLRLLAPPVKPSDVQSIISGLDTSVIARKVATRHAQGLSPEFWILLTHSMGDIVACEPIARHLHELSPRCKIHWIVETPFREILEGNPNIDDIVIVNSLAEGKDLVAKCKADNSAAIIVDCHFNGTSCPKTNRIFPNLANPQVTIHTYYAIGPLLETYALAAGLPRLNDAPIFHFTEDAALPQCVPSGAVVFHCRSSEQARNWTDANWNQLAATLTAQGKIVVEVGTERVLEPRKGVVDFTGRHSLQQLARIVQKASLFIGVDSVFSHVANATRTPAVILLGKYRNFPVYMPYTGEFAHSPAFRIVRAPNHGPAAEITCDSVLAAIVQA